MEILDLKTIFSNSFIDYVGRRTAIITLQGKRKKNRLNQRLKIEGISIVKYEFDSINSKTILEVRSMDKPFLPVEEEIDKKDLPSEGKFYEDSQKIIVKTPEVADIIEFFPEMAADHNWKEDYSFENGCYKNTCGGCDKTFYGHKRRTRCKPCMKAHVAASDGTVILPK